MNSVNRIIRMRDYSLRYGGDGSVRGFVLEWRQRMKKQGVVVQVKVDEDARGSAVVARIWQGQWVAECDVCNGNEFVDPEDAVFFCFGCANRENHHYLRPVTFPDNWQAIEEAVLERPVHDRKGVTELERAGMARPAVIVRTDGVDFPLARSWNPGETLEELRKQNSVLVGLELKERETVVVEVTSPTPPPAPPQTGLDTRDALLNQRLGRGEE